MRLYLINLVGVRSLRVSGMDEQLVSSLFNWKYFDIMRNLFRLGPSQFVVV
jgi:hypothetical protein